MALESLVQTIQTFIQTYGLLAVFVYLALETGMILHFAPSELVVPFAAAELVHGPISFVAFVLVATAGAGVGALFPYAIFQRYGRTSLDRYGRYVHITPEDVDRGERWFGRWGESSVLWGRVLPFVRAYISIPAGLAAMNVRKYVLYSTLGAGAYNVLITYLVYTGESASSPLHVVWNRALTALFLEIAYIHSHVFVDATVFGLLVVATAWVWWRRDAIRADPSSALRHTILILAALGTVASAGLLLGAALSPYTTYELVTGVWNDPTFFVTYGASRQLALLLTGGLGLTTAVFLFALARLLPLVEAVTGLISRALVVESA